MFQKFASTTNISFCEDFKFRQKFKTKAEAGTYALDAAKRWIDDSTPELLQKAK